MIKQLKSLFSKTDPSAVIDASAKAVLPFLRSAHQTVELRDFMTPRLHSLIYCFAYGALDVEAHERGMNETQQLAVLFQLINTLSELDSRDSSALLNKCMETMAKDEGRSFVLTGSQSYQAWRDADSSAAKNLSEKLHSVNL